MNYIRIMTDNSTKICYINKPGGIKSMTWNDIAKETQEFCTPTGVYLAVVHKSGIHNVTVDAASCEFKDNHERGLSPIVFTELASFWAS